jgi:parallel beta-helix repeat protein
MMAVLAAVAVLAGAAIVRLSRSEESRTPAVATPTESLPTPAETATARSKCVRAGVGSNIQRLIDANPRGTSFCINPGVHRLTEPLKPRDRQRFVGAPGSVLNGARVVDAWTKDGSIWISPRQTQGPTRIEWSGSTIKYPEARFADDVFYDGALLKRVTSRGEVSSGKFFFDYENDAIYIGDDPTGHVVELATAESIFTGPAGGVVIQGLAIEKSRGRGVITGEGWIIEGCEIRLHATQGVRLASRSTARRNNLHHNGQYGITGTGLFLRVEENEIAFNNTHLFYIASGGNWASGGTKFVQTGDPKLGRDSGIILRGNNAHHNLGDGLWLDIDNIYATIDGNTTSDNERRGINYEISYDAVISYNTVTANGEAGIRISSSPNVEIFQNTVTANGAGIVVSDDPRGRGKYGPHRSRGTSMHDNIEQGNGSA